MGNENATLLRQPGQTRHPDGLFVLIDAARGEFPAPGESYLSLILKRLGATR